MRWIVNYSFVVEQERVIEAPTYDMAYDIATRAGRNQFGRTFELIDVYPEDEDNRW